MSNFKFVVLIVIIITVSCTKKIRLIYNTPCLFDNENLKVYSQNSNDTIFHFGRVGYDLAFHYLDYGNTSYIRSNYHNVSKKEFWLKTFSISNIGCKDTLWAKKLIKEELKSRFPYDYSYSDTFCILKHYNVKLVDSSLLVRSIFSTEDISGSLSGDVNDWITSHGVEYKNISQHVVPNLYGQVDVDMCDKSVGYMSDSISGFYDLKIYPNVYEQLGEAAHIKMIRDSLGFDIKWVKDEIVPYKIITYTKKSIE